MARTKIHLPVLGLAGLGCVSGVLSTYPPTTVEEFMLLDVPIYPGVVFGLAVGFGLLRWGRTSWIGAFLAFLLTNAAWIAAVHSFYLITDDASANLYLGGFFAGAIGSAGTLLGGAISIRSLRAPRLWILTVFVGAVAGLLVVPEARSAEQSFMILFIVWQGAVAACVGYGLVRSDSTGRHGRGRRISGHS